jgi:hypothetical protein
MMTERVPFMVRKRAPYNLKKGETFLADNGKRYKVTSINDISFFRIEYNSSYFFR